MFIYCSKEGIEIKSGAVENFLNIKFEQKNILVKSKIQTRNETEKRTIICLTLYFSKHLMLSTNKLKYIKTFILTMVTIKLPQINFYEYIIVNKATSRENQYFPNQ